MSGDGYEVCVECGREKGSDSESQVHHYKTDPRFEVATKVAAWFPIYREEEACRLDTPAERLLAELDAADLGDGIVRVDTKDKELVVKIAEVIYTELPRLRGVNSVARAVVAVLLEATDHSEGRGGSMSPQRSKQDVLDVMTRATAAVQQLPDDVGLERSYVTGNLIVTRDGTYLGYVDLYGTGRFESLRDDEAEGEQ